MNFLINYIKKKKVEKEELQKNVKLKNIYKHIILLAFIIFFCSFATYSIFNNYANIQKGKYKEVEKVDKQLSLVQKRIKKRMLNQKAEALNIPKLHFDYPRIENYSTTWINHDAYFLNLKSKKQELIRKGSILIVIHYPMGKYYYIFGGQLYKKEKNV